MRFATEATTRYVVIVDRHGKATWCFVDSTATKRASFFFSQGKIQKAVEVIVNGAFFVFGSALYHQDKAISMGINCAVHMADQYLWTLARTYEMEFVPVAIT